MNQFTIIAFKDQNDEYGFIVLNINDDVSQVIPELEASGCYDFNVSTETIPAKKYDSKNGII